MTGPLSIFDRPNSYIGKSVPRPDAKRLAEGRGRYVDDKQSPRLLHAAFLRSPYAHARLKDVDLSDAKTSPGAVAAFTGADLAPHVEPYVGVLTHLAGLRSPPQHPMAIDRVRWQGEPVAMVLATSRAAAEDAVEKITADYEELAALTAPEAALDPDAPRLHTEFDSNLAWERTVDVGDVEAAFARSDVTVVEREFRFGRHTGVTLEPRTALANYEPGSGRLTFHYSGQAPHMMQAILAKHLGLPEEDVRVVAEDVGGSFGIKIHTYGDEIATAAAAKLLKRPVKFVADRSESFVSDIHARDHIVRAKMAVTGEGKIAGLEFD
ncbi:MAG: molybdopterin cofactor-binding domain-containing protein, partial [Pseudomonadota bacterium]